MMTFKEFLKEMREPKTKQEMGMDHTDDDAPKVRSKRNRKNLPNAWDDKGPGRTRSWKKHRKSQYK